MGKPPLDNYLRTYRRQLALSQEDVAFLVGCNSKSTVSHHEHGKNDPSLDFLLAYELVLGIPIRELFAGRLFKIEPGIRKRAAELIESVSAETVNALTARKLETLAGLAETTEPLTIPLWND